MMSLEIPIYPPPVGEAPIAGVAVDPKIGKLVLDSMVEVGVANLRLSPEQNDVLVELYSAGDGFFSQPLPTKENHETSDRKVGYRPHGAAYTGTDKGKMDPDPDANDSMLLGRAEAPIPGQDDPKAARLLSAMRDFRDLIAAPTVEAVHAALADRYGYPYARPFRKGSVTQINSYCLSDERHAVGTEDIPLKDPEAPQAQGPHEDGVEITVLSSNYFGLAGRTRNGLYVPVSHGESRKRAVSVFGSRVLAEATGGDVPPFIHRAFNFLSPEKRDFRRLTMTYFSSPDVTKGVPVPAYVGGHDISDKIREGTEQFGIGSDFTGVPD